VSRARILVVTASVILALFLAAIELTVVGTAMPTIISQLGGFAAYSWVFSVYALTSTMMTPIFGKLSDQFGRKPVFLVGMGIFLVGSALSGLAQTMSQLILFRAIQGLGAGALIPLSFTIVGDIYTVQERTRIQGLFSSTWAISSLLGPLVGGFLVEKQSWRWVFYINIPFGLLAMGLLWASLREPARDKGRAQIDVLGAGLLSISIIALLIAILEGGRQWAWLSLPTFALLGTSLVTFILLLRVERRVPEPILALDLFKDRMVQVSATHGFLAGLALFGSTSFIPLFAQGVLGTSATVAGATLAPQIIGWTLASTFGAPFILRLGYRTVSIVGMVVMVFGAAILALLGPALTQWTLALSMVFFGGGMGLTLTTMIIAVQNRVTRTEMGSATSMMTFMRTIGGAIGVSIMGAVMTARLTTELALRGIVDITPEMLLDPIQSKQIAPEALAVVRDALAIALQPVFVIALVGSVLALIVVFFTPRGSVEELSNRSITSKGGGRSKKEVGGGITSFFLLPPFLLP
jgi:EmrB/QacA subfamily drug resistance transporter